MRIENIQVANASNGGQYMIFWVTSAPLGSTTTVVDKMSILKIQNYTQTQYIGNCTNSGLTQGVMYHDFPYTYDNFPTTGLSLYTQSSAGGSNTT